MTRKNFQLIILVTFGVFIFIGFISLGLFGLIQGRDGAQQSDLAERVVINVWGTLPESQVNLVLTNINRIQNDYYSSVNYFEKDKESFVFDYFEAAAKNEAPNLLLVDEETIFTLQDSLQTIPFETINLADYQNEFIDSSSVFIKNDGILAIPFLQDVFVLYYNENIRLRSGVRLLPKVWSDFSNFSNFRNILNSNFSVQELSLIPLGSYNNYDNIIYLLSTLLFQIENFGQDVSVDEFAKILDYYKNFANPNTSVYTWNSTLPNARDMFIGDRLLFYPGLSSERNDIKRANPNLVIRSLNIPKIRSNDSLITTSNLIAFAVPKINNNPVPSVIAAYNFVDFFKDPSANPQEIFSLLPAVKSWQLKSSATNDERIVYNSSFAGRIIPLGKKEKESVLEILRLVVVGAISSEEGAKQIIDIYY